MPVQTKEQEVQGARVQESAEENKGAQKPSLLRVRTKRCSKWAFLLSLPR